LKLEPILGPEHSTLEASKTNLAKFNKFLTAADKILFYHYPHLNFFASFLEALGTSRPISSCGGKGSILVMR